MVLRISSAVRQTEGVKVDVKNLDGTMMTWRSATQPVGSALRIAPKFVASTRDEATGVQTTIEAHYSHDEGRYIVAAITNRAFRDDFDQQALRRTASVAILQAAVPQCIAVRLTDEDETGWTSIADLTSSEGRIIPPWMAAAAVKRGGKDERMEVIEIIYGASALAGIPPVRAVQLELDIPHRTASDWIKKARDNGRLDGMTYNVGRQADGQ
ncbi:hypothetical protein [Microbacterium sp. LWH11-1.2]|uniref:hypothetical protein n=1 Tax=unclassified Microbacterium TaxID=2609290 RepID=UPI003139FED6